MSDARSGGAFRGAGQLLEPGMIGQIRLAWRLMRDPRVGRFKLVIPALAVLYVLLPVDLAPDFLPGIGQIDDLGVLVALLLVTIRLLPGIAPRDVVQEHLAGMRGQSPGASPDPDWGGGPVFDGQYRVRE